MSSSEVFFSSENDSERNSEVFSLPKMVLNGILRFFSSKNGSKRNSRGFSLPRNGSEWNSEGLSLPRNGSEGNSKVSLLRNGLERISKGFSLPRNGSERTEVFLFRETGGILTELLSVLSCSAFCGTIFCWKMATLIHGESQPPMVNTLGNLDHL